MNRKKQIECEWENKFNMIGDSLFFYRCIGSLQFQAIERRKNFDEVIFLFYKSKVEKDIFFQNKMNNILSL